MSEYERGWHDGWEACRAYLFGKSAQTTPRLDGIGTSPDAHQYSDTCEADHE